MSWFHQGGKDGHGTISLHVYVVWLVQLFKFLVENKKFCLFFPLKHVHAIFIINLSEFQ